MWREVNEGEPMAMDAHRNLAQLLAELEKDRCGISASEERRRAISAQLSDPSALDRMGAGDDPNAAEPVIRRLIEIHPADAWAQRSWRGLC